VYYEYDTLEYDTSRAYVSVLTVSEIQTVLANSTQSSITFDIVLFERKRVDSAQSFIRKIGLDPA